MSRRGVDNGLTATLEWLTEWYGELDDVSVKRICLPEYTNNPKSVLSDEAYQLASVGKQTPLHVFLKYRVFKWCQEIHGVNAPEFETRMYFPIEELIDLMKKYSVSYSGSDFDVTKSQLLPKLKNGETEFRDCSNGEIIIADIYSNRTVYEIGYTTAFSLFTPILEGLADRAIWFPFPKGVKLKAFDINLHSDIDFHGYEIVIDE